VVVAESESDRKEVKRKGEKRDRNKMIIK